MLISVALHRKCMKLSELYKALWDIWICTLLMDFIELIRINKEFNFI